jgi:hypothetical protein
MTIRQNYSEGRIVAPEWERGLPPKSAAYASGPLGSTVTIKAKFGGGPPGEVVNIRAVDADRLSEPTGCLGLIVYLFLALIKAFGGNVLGEAAATTVAFDALGNSAVETMTLSSHKLKTSGIGERITNWNWEYKGPEGWTKFDQTRHRIFVVLDTPRRPWSQQIAPELIAHALGGAEIAYIENTQLPWVEALEVACGWAQGVTEKHAAASAITIAVNSKTPQVYNTFTNYGAFHLTWYLADLKAGAPFQTNCTDCANAVTTLGNLLGCDLFSQYLSTSFEPTKPFLTLNGDPSNPADWVSYMWSYHEFSWIGPSNQAGSVYDACLRLDVDDDPDDAVHIARHALAMPFTSYSPRLWNQVGGLDYQSRRGVY